MDKQDKEYLQLIGRNIRKLREEKGMSQQALADYSDLAKTTIQRIELARMNPSILLLKKITTALETDIATLTNNS